jgi:anaerobic selenocysteine-containing dehydrogenase
MDAHAAPMSRFLTCNLCEAMCGLKVEVEGGRVVSIEGDADDPFGRGYVCPKGAALGDLHTDPDRLRQPVRRTAAGWQTVSWDEALDEAARGLHAVQRGHGRDAVATYIGNPAVHDHGILTFLPILRALRTKNRFSASSADQLPHMVAASLMFGHGLLMPVPDIDRTDYLLMLGANPLASNGSLMTAPGAGRRLAELRRRGGKIVVVDPRRTETARAADEHLFIRPGADALFLLALVNELLEAGPRLGRLAGCTDGLEALREAASPFTPERSVPHTGISAGTVRRLAREFRTAGAAVCYGRVGISTQAFGGLCAWLITAVNAVTGNLDRPGGAMFTRPAFDPVKGPRLLAPRVGGFARRKSRVRGLPAFAGELPVAVMAEEMLTPGEGQVRALVTVAGNPVLSTPNGGQLDRALESLEFMVSIDPYLNETTRHARVILPGVAPLERAHYDVAFHALAVRNTAKYAPALFAPPAGAKDDWEILLELGRRLEKLRGGRGVRNAAAYGLLKRLGPDGILGLGLRLGPHGPGLNPLASGLTLRRLARQPHGVDLGPLEPCLPGRLATPRNRIDLAPAAFLADLDRLGKTYPAEEAAPGNGTLSLIGRRNVRDNNSWMHNLPRLMRGASRCTLLIHPGDAASRGLADGDVVDVSSRAGSVRVTVSVTDDVMPGVVCLPHGYGHDRAGIRLSIAARHAGVSANDLTDEKLVDGLTGNAAFSGVPVRVARCA